MGQLDSYCRRPTLFGLYRELDLPKQEGAQSGGCSVGELDSDIIAIYCESVMPSERMSRMRTQVEREREEQEPRVGVGLPQEMVGSGDISVRDVLSVQDAIVGASLPTLIVIHIAFFINYNIQAVTGVRCCTEEDIKHIQVNPVLVQSRSVIMGDPVDSDV